MCRLLGYLGKPVSLHPLLCQPEHSLIVQSYQPREMTSGLLNADGYGIGWYDRRKQTQAFRYRSILPVWSDLNLESLSRYIESDCMLAYVRSATPGQAVDLSNCQPFTYGDLSFIHNGAVDRFRDTLYRPLRDRFSDELYQSILGSTDSEHIFTLLLQVLQENPQWAIAQALKTTLLELHQLAVQHDVRLSANLILSDGQRLIASRFAANTTAPTLYWLQNDPHFPEAVLIASEPLFPGAWQPFPEASILQVGEDFSLDWYDLSPELPSQEPA